MAKDNKQTTLDYNIKLHILGRIWTLTGLFLIIMVPVVISIFYDAKMDWQVFANAGVITLLFINFASAVLEPIIYSPMLGTNGEYLAFITGNLANMKIPCVVKAHEIYETKQGSEEQEIISTIAIAISSLVTVLIVFVIVIALSVSPLQDWITQNRFLNNAFGSVVYALFGALGGKYLVKNLKLASIPGIIVIVLSIILAVVGMNLGSALLVVGIAAMLIRAAIPLISGMVKAKKEKKIYDNISNGIDLEETYAIIMAQNAKAEKKNKKK